MSFSSSPPLSPIPEEKLALEVARCQEEVASAQANLEAKKLASQRAVAGKKRTAAQAVKKAEKKHEQTVATLSVAQAALKAYEAAEALHKKETAHVPEGQFMPNDADEAAVEAKRKAAAAAKPPIVEGEVALDNDEATAEVKRKDAAASKPLVVEGKIVLDDGEATLEAKHKAAMAVEPPVVEGEVVPPRDDSEADRQKHKGKSSRGKAAEETATSEKSGKRKRETKAKAKPKERTLQQINDSAESVDEDDAAHRKRVKIPKYTPADVEHLEQLLDALINTVGTTKLTAEGKQTMDDRRREIETQLIRVRAELADPTYDYISPDSDDLSSDDNKSSDTGEDGDTTDDGEKPQAKGKTTGKGAGQTAGAKRAGAKVAVPKVAGTKGKAKGDAKDDDKPRGDKDGKGSGKHDIEYTWWNSFTPDAEHDQDTYPDGPEKWREDVTDACEKAVFKYLNNNKRKSYIIPAVYRRLMRKVAEVAPECATSSKELAIHILTLKSGMTTCRFHDEKGDTKAGKSVDGPTESKFTLVGVPYSKGISMPAGFFECGCAEQDALFDLMWFKTWKLKSANPALTEVEDMKNDCLGSRHRTLFAQMHEHSTLLDVEDYYTKEYDFATAEHQTRLRILQLERLVGELNRLDGSNFQYRAVRERKVAKTAPMQE